MDEYITTKKLKRNEDRIQNNFFVLTTAAVVSMCVFTGLTKLG